MTGTDTARAPAAAAPRWAVWVAYLTHVTILFAIFPPREMLSDSPWFADDFPTRFRFGLTQARLLERGWLTGYDPGFAAGFPEVRHLPAGGHVFQLALAIAGPWVGYARAFNVTCVLLTAVALPLLAWSARAAGLGVAASWVPLVALPVLWSGIPFSFPITGNAMWLAASGLALATAAAYRRFLIDGSARDWALATLGASAIATVHEAAALVVLMFALPFFLARVPELDGRRIAATAAAPLVAAILNYYWLAPFLAHVGIAESYGSGTVEVYDAAFTLLVLLYPHGLPALLILYGFAVAGFRSLRIGVRPPGTRWLLVTLVSIPLAFAFLGYAWSVTRWFEPYRFVVPATMALTLAASVALAERDGRAMAAWRRVWPWASSALAVALSVLNPISPPLPIRSGLTPEARGLVSLLQVRGDRDRRLLLENSGFERPHESWTQNFADPGHHYFGTHLPSMLPEITGLELVNGAEIGAPFIRHETVRFETRELDGRPIGSWTASELRPILDRYAIGQVLVWSDEARAAFAKLAELLEPSGTIGSFSLYRVREPTSRFLVGTGRIASSLDRIELDDLEPVNGRVVIRYHYDAALAADPPVRLERVDVPGDPVGFIVLVDPPRHVRLGFHPRAPPLAPSPISIARGSSGRPSWPPGGDASFAPRAASRPDSCPRYPRARMNPAPTNDRTGRPRIYAPPD